MKTIKPQKLGVLHRTFEDEGRCYLCLTVLALFSFGERPGLLTEVDLWKLAAAELGKDTPIDLAMPKRRGELLVTAKAYAPRGVPAPALSVRVALGAIDKTLWVGGDRRWTPTGTTEPEPFVEMPVTWARAFGGAAFPENPVGKGAAAVGDIWPLPNVEDPRRLVRSPDDKPTPAGFGAYDLTWPQRWSKVGTYDAAWLASRFPGFATDTDLGMFNAAPDDQQIDGFFRGDETFVLENLHATRPLVEGSLPSLATRAFITRKTTDGEAFGEVAMHLDTVHLFPHLESGMLVFRGLTTVAEDDAADVLHLVVAGEALGDPRPVEHYREVLRRRLDPKKGHLFLLRDGELMPPGAASAREKTDVEVLVESEQLLQRNMLAGARRRAEENRQAMVTRLTALGLNPADFHVAADSPPEEAEQEAPDLDNLDAFVEQVEARAEAQRAEAEAQKTEAETEARARFAASGMDYDKLAAEAQEKGAGPPRFSAKAERERLDDLAVLLRNAGHPHSELEAALADPAFDRRLAEQEAHAREGYRQAAHLGAAAPRLAGTAATRLREEVIGAHARGESLAGRDLTGVDLSDLPLRGVDFTDAQLESASFAGADLRGVTLSRAVLARADLTGADLRGAKMREANLGLAVLAGADVSEADLSWAVLYRADLARAAFRRATLTFADFSEAVLRDNDFTGASAQLLTFLRADLSGARFAGADLCRCTFLECKLTGTDFSDARMISATFVTSEGRGVVLRGANLENARMIERCAFEAADLRAATLTGANLRGTRLAGADFTNAKMDGADLSDCDLTAATLEGITAREARLVRANLTGAKLKLADLMQAVLQKAELGGADLAQANLFRADLAKVAGDERTSLKGANVVQARFVRRAHGHA